jgi:stress response protein YsnF
VPFDEQLAREHIEVERHPIGRVVEEVPPVRNEGDVIVVSVVEERLVTSKELVLVEEIRLTLHREATRVQGEIPLRRERVVIERLDPATNQWRPEGPETKDLKE